MAMTCTPESVRTEIVAVHDSIQVKSAEASTPMASRKKMTPMGRPDFQWVEINDCADDCEQDVSCVADGADF